MNRGATNLIRFFMDDCLPAVIRDNRYFMWPFFYLAYGGKDVGPIMDFKSRVQHFTPEEYEAFYSGLNSISRRRQTDLNQPCIDYLLDNIDEGTESLLDAGCGNAWLLRRAAERYPGIALTACDVVAERADLPFDYLKSDIQNLALPENSHELVLCCHTLEHVPELRQSVSELMRVCRRTLFIVVPCQRYFYYTLDEHVHFFTDRHQLFSQMGLDESRVMDCRKLKGDWLLVVDCSTLAEASE